MTDLTQKIHFFRFQTDISRNDEIIDKKIELCCRYFVEFDNKVFYDDKQWIESIDLSSHPEIYTQVQALQVALVSVAIAQITAREQGAIAP